MGAAVAAAATGSGPGTTQTYRLPLSRLAFHCFLDGRDKSSRKRGLGKKPLKALLPHQAAVYADRRQRLLAAGGFCCLLPSGEPPNDHNRCRKVLARLLRCGFQDLPESGTMCCMLFRDEVAELLAPPLPQRGMARVRGRRRPKPCPNPLSVLEVR
jgi:hypothetical protein